MQDRATTIIRRVKTIERVIEKKSNIAIAILEKKHNYIPSALKFISLSNILL